MKVVFLATVVSFLIIAPHVVGQERCELRGPKVAKYAQKQGHTFKVEVEPEHTGRCTLSNHNAGASLASGTCTLVLFESTNLNSPWTFERASYAGRGFTIERAPLPGDTELGFSIQLNSVKGKPVKFLLSYVVLTGGSCKQWKTAF
ncbi:MAG: hypothetical protein DHS20C11_11470 [Lysobacteraceae bacterium]|nr:MAG: hypothetical protein DHS20C11_11470 [Xanthomonadaceae bacterium]